MPPQFLSVSPVLGTLDLSEAIAFYQNTLGFTLDWRQDEPSSFAAVSRDGCGFLLSLQETLPALPGRPAGTVDAYLTVTDLDRLYSELVGRGAKVIFGPATRDYGMREFIVEDYSGYRLVFAQPLGD